MKRALSNFRNILLALLSLLLFGCDFDDPITPSALIRTNPALTGKWAWHDKDEIVYVALLPMGLRQYSGKMWPESEPDKTETFTATPAEVGGSTFLSVDLGEKENKRYLYVRLTVLSNKTVRYEQVSSDSTFAKDRTGTVSDRLRRHLNDKDLFRVTRIFEKQP